MSQDFGSYLKHERELRGVPLDQIAESTKISLRFLRALEEGRFEDLPGEVFIKGFIRSYGQAIGSNVDELMAAYHESGSNPQDPGSSNTESSSSIDEPLARPFVFPTQAVIGFGIALLIIVGGVYWFTTQKGEKAGQSQQTRAATPSMADENLPETEAGAEFHVSGEDGASVPAAEGQTPAADPAEGTGTAEPPAAAAPDPSVPQTPEAATAIKNTVTVSEKDVIIKDLKDQLVPESVEPVAEFAMGDASLNLVIQVDENSWFNLRIDDQRDQDFILPPGGSKTIQANNVIVMTIGNRRATQMILNGQQLDLPESPDNVIRNLTVNAEQLN